MSKKSKTPVPANPNATDAARAQALQRLVAPAPKATVLPTAGPVASVAAVGAVAGSPVPPKAKGKGAKAKATKPAKEPKAPKAPKEKKPKKVSGLDAAAMVLAESKAPMNMKQVFAEIQSRKLWTTKGQTPEATLYAAVIREIAAKGKESRFKRHDRGLFTATKGA